MTFFLDFLLQMYLQLHPNQYLYLYMHIIDKVQLVIHQFESFYCMICLCKVLKYFIHMSMLLQEMSVISLRSHGYLETAAFLTSLKQQVRIWVCPVVVPKKSTKIIYN